MKCFMSTRPLSSGEKFDDNNLYCPHCDKVHLGNCPIHGPMIRVADTPVEDEDDPLKALNTVPPALSIQESTIPRAGLGVVAEKDIDMGTVFGPYMGREVALDSIEARKSDYCWEIRGPLGPIHCIDGLPIASSNWMRFVNCANSQELENAKAFQYKGHVFYRTTKDIAKGSELLVYYGPKFAKKLGLDFVGRKHRPGDGDRLSGEVVPKTEAADTSGTDMDIDDVNQRGVFKTCMPLMSAPKVEPALTSPTKTSPTKYKRKTFDLPPRQLRSSSRVAAATVASTEADPAPASTPVPVKLEPDESPGVHDDEFAFDYAVCGACGLGFSCPPLLQRHVEEIHVQPLFIEDCEHCTERFISGKAKRRHLRKKHGIECPIEAAERAERQSRKRKRKEASQNEHKTRFQCDLCELNYKFSGHLAEHQFLKHGISIVYGCAQCHLKFDFFIQLRDHMKDTGHRGKERIRVGADADMDQSILAATGLAPDQKILQSLISRQERLRPLKCSVCPEAFQKTNVLRQHEAKMHGIVVTYTCRMCRQEFSVFANLIDHHGETGHKGTDRKFVGPGGGGVENQQPSTDQPTTDVNSKPSLEPQIKHHDVGNGAVEVVKKKRKLENDGQFRCLRCNFSTKYASNLKQHTIKFHKIRTLYSCKACGQSCGSDFKVIRKHWADSGHRGSERKLVGPDNEVICEDKPSDSGQQLASEVAGVDSRVGKKRGLLEPGSLKCDTCDYSSNDKRRLAQHKQRKHGIKVEFTCLVCRESFQGLVEKRKHMTETGHKDMDRRLVKPNDPVEIARRKGKKPADIPFNRGSIPNARVTSLKTQMCLNVWKRRGEQQRRALYRCFRCPYKSQSSSILRVHQKNRHGIGVVYSCGVCRLAMSGYQVLKKHQGESGHVGIVRKRSQQQNVRRSRLFAKNKASAGGATNQAIVPIRIPLHLHSNSNTISTTTAKPSTKWGRPIAAPAPRKTYMMRHHNRSPAPTNAPTMNDPPPVKAGGTSWSRSKTAKRMSKNHACLHCDMSFVWNGHLKRHMLSKHAALSAQAVPAMADPPSELEQPGRETDGDTSGPPSARHGCKWCDVTLESKVLLGTHIQTSHRDRMSILCKSSPKQVKDGEEKFVQGPSTPSEPTVVNVTIAQPAVVTQKNHFQNAFLAFLGASSTPPALTQPYETTSNCGVPGTSDVPNVSSVLKVTKKFTVPKVSTVSTVRTKPAVIKVATVSDVSTVMNVSTDPKASTDVKVPTVKKMSTVRKKAVVIKVAPVPNESTELKAFTDSTVSSDPVVSSVPIVSSEPNMLTVSKVSTIRKKAVVSKVVANLGVSTNSKASPDSNVSSDPKMSTDSKMVTVSKVSTVRKKVVAPKVVTVPEISTDSKASTEPKVSPDTEILNNSADPKVFPVWRKPILPNVSTDPKILNNSTVLKMSPVRRKPSVPKVSTDSEIPNDSTVPKVSTDPEILNNSTVQKVSPVRRKLPEVSVCPVCTEIFENTDLLSVHVSKKHGLIMTYQCCVCKKKCNTVRGARIHQIKSRHSGDIIRHFDPPVVMSSPPMASGETIVPRAQNKRLHEVVVGTEILLRNGSDMKLPVAEETKMKVTPSGTSESSDTYGRHVDDDGVSTTALTSQSKLKVGLVSSLINEKVPNVPQQQLNSGSGAANLQQAGPIPETQSVVNLHVCSRCDRIFTCMSALESHVIGHHQNPCGDASKNYASPSRRPRVSQKSVGGVEPSPEIADQSDEKVARVTSPSLRPPSEQLSISSSSKSGLSESREVNSG